MIDTMILDAEFVPVRCSLEARFGTGSADGHESVVARWDAGPLGRDYLCRPCLDASLDWADANGTGEPVALTWVMRPVDLWCGRHDWPARLCRDWRHGLGYNLFGQHWTEYRPPLVIEPISLARHITIERWQVGMATPEHPCWCARKTCTGCSSNR